MSAALLMLAGCGRPQRVALQVEQLEDERAQVVDLDSGRAAHLPRRTLPAGVKEGDVIVDGRFDPQLTAELRRQVAELHERLAVPLPVNFDLGEPRQPALTIPEE